MADTPPKPMDMQTTLLALQQIKTRMEQLQDQTRHTSQDVSLTKVNTETLLPLLALLETPQPEEMTLAQNLATTLAAISDRLGKIEETVKKLSQDQEKLTAAIMGMHSAQTLMKKDMVIVKEQLGAFFGDEDLDAG